MLSPAKLAWLVCAAAAAVPATSAPSLLSAKALQCQTSFGTATTWDAGRPVSKSSDSSLRYEYRDIDATEHRATLVGQAGTGSVEVIRTLSTISFVERGSNGALFVDTVYASARSGPTDGRFALVASRHNPLLGDPVSSQFHGWCEVTK